jgi:hypothetical protein
MTSLQLLTNGTGHLDKKKRLLERKDNSKGTTLQYFDRKRYFDRKDILKKTFGKTTF